MSDAISKYTNAKRALPVWDGVRMIHPTCRCRVCESARAALASVTKKLEAAQ